MNKGPDHDSLYVAAGRFGPNPIPRLVSRNTTQVSCVGTFDPEDYPWSNYPFDIISLLQRFQFVVRPPACSSPSRRQTRLRVLEILWCSLGIFRSQDLTPFDPRVGSLKTSSIESTRHEDYRSNISGLYDEV